MSTTPDQLLAQLSADARDGNPLALHRLALELVRRQRLDEAFALQLRAAQGGVADAQHEVGRMLLHGAGTAADIPGAIQWLQRAEAAGNVVSGYELALVAIGGAWLPRDSRINQRVMAAVDAGFPPALRAAAIHFGRKPDAADQALCLQLLQRAAAAGDDIAALLLAERLQRGEGTAPRPELAAQLFAQTQARQWPRLPAVTAARPQQAPSRPTTLALSDALQSPPPQVLSAHPAVRCIDHLLSADECRLLVAAARPRLEASEVVRADTGKLERASFRSSSDATFDALAEDLALRLVQQRMAAAAGMELLHGEPLTILRYEVGQEYQPHRDYAPPGSIERDHPQAGNRARTICVYLNDVEAGGQTAFPLAGLSIEPAAGRAVIFDNLHADGRPDPDTLHAGVPVERGEKWLATLWLRQRRYRDF
jgi:hypothetical protein